MKGKGQDKICRFSKPFKEKEDAENKRKVADFVKNLEKKSGGKKYTQTKIKLNSLKDANN